MAELLIQTCPNNMRAESETFRAGLLKILGLSLSCSGNVAITRMRSVGKNATAVPHWVHCCIAMKIICVARNAILNLGPGIKT